MHIVLDAMGGDHAPLEPCMAAIQACRWKNDLYISLVGDSEKIKEHIEKAEPSVKDRLSIVQASDVISAADPPSISIRRKKDSSLVVGFEMVKEGKADGIVSAGNTGAIAAGGVLILGRISGIDRPGFGVMMPLVHMTTLLMDVGATVRCKPENLLQFAKMGSIYMKLFAGVQNPSVYILNMGEEDIKGDDVIAGARDMIAGSGLNYKGFAEANYMMSGIADVVVCDGFTGNVLLKFAEGLGELIQGQLREEYTNHMLPKIGLAFMYPAIKRIMGRFDWEKVGGCPLLGVNGAVIKVHGRSKRNAISYALINAADFTEAHGVERIREELAKESNNGSF